MIHIAKDYSIVFTMLSLPSNKLESISLETLLTKSAYLSIPFIDELRTRNLKSNQTDSEIIQNYLAGLETVEEFAQIIFRLALEDTKPEMLQKISSIPWLNAWAISLDASQWEADGLFEPKSEPRSLDRIQTQIWEAIGR